MEKIIISYLLFINGLGYISMGVDKKRAIKKRFRISEQRLFCIAILGGSIGSMLGMNYFRHKTKHKSFVYGMPAILLFHIVIIILCAFVFFR